MSESFTGKASIYPNLTCSALNIESIPELAGSEIRILNNKGQLVWQGEVSSHFQTIQLEKLTPETYTLEVTNNQKTIAQKKLVKL